MTHSHSQTRDTSQRATPPATRVHSEFPGAFYSQVNSWGHALSAVSRAITAIAGRVRFPLYRRTSANTYGFAPTTSQTGKPVSQKQLPLILVERELLIRQIAQNQRHHRATFSAAKRLREITHQQLKLELTGKEPS